MKFNVEVVDNRYARAGVNFLLAPVYALTTAADYIVFNSIEFWAGKNPLTGAPHIFDSKVDTMIDVNDSQKAVLTEVRDGDKVSYYMDGTLVSETSIQALEQLAAEKV